MRRSLRSLLATTLLLGAACSSATESETIIVDPPTTGFAAGSVQATRVTGGIRLTNGTEHPIGYAVANPSWLGLLGACTTEPGCLKLVQGQSVVVRDQDIAGYAPGMTTAIVYTWAILPDASGTPRASTVSQQRITM